MILEPPSGKLNSDSSSINLIRNNTIGYNKIFTQFTNGELIDYFKNTKRGLSYGNVYGYITGDGARFNEILNQLVLYKDINDKENLKNQILYALNVLGYDFAYAPPTFTGSKLYGIFRDRWYSLDEYIAAYFDESRTRTIGILESTMYISSQQLHPTIAIIESLESKGYNVIPVYAAGGSAEQLRVMVESWTSAGSDIAGFLENSSKYTTYVDAIISMVAYGVGGENFTKATDFFEEVGVPVFRAVHSDYVSNEMWELGSTGLTTQIEKTTEKIGELKNKIPIKRGRAKKTEKKLIKNQNQRKKLKLENDKNKFKLKQYKKEVKEYIQYKEKISKIFKSKSIKTAMKRFNKLNEKINEMPEIIQDFMRKLSKKLEITLNHTKNRKIPSTNNLAELLFRVTFPGKIKRIFRTYEGAKRQIRLNNLNWTKRNVLGEK